jgi:hypothetical protein
MPGTGNFDSVSSTLEYSILSAILGSSPPDGTLDMSLLPPGPQPSPLSLGLELEMEIGRGLGLDSRMLPEPYAMGGLGAGPGMPGSVNEPLEGSP